MRRALLAACLLLAAAVPAALGTTSAPPPPSLRAETTTWLSDRLVELAFSNPLLDPPFPSTKARVLLPDGHASSGKRYPVVLLLHGIGDSARAWTTNQDGWPVTLEAFTADKDVIVVMPDGGHGATAGWYSDWYNGGAFGSPAWETYHLDQLLAYVDASFPTRPGRAGRVVAGLSMGGFGAMSYAARHPDRFAGAFSFSGALDTTLLGGIFDERIWGRRVLDDIRRRGHNPVDLADNLADTRVWFRTGMGVAGGPGPKDAESVGLEALLWPTNESFAEALRGAGVAHAYEAYPQGGHNWYHWQDGFQRAWPQMQELFDHPRPAPSSFRYRSAEPAFGIWGWDVAVARPVPELLQLRDVSAGGLRLEGSGTVDLVTPPAYRPGGTYSVHGPTASLLPRLVRAGDDGRLRFAVPLGQPSTGLPVLTPPGVVPTATVTVTISPLG